MPLMRTRTAPKSYEDGDEVPGYVQRAVTFMLRHRPTSYRDAVNASGLATDVIYDHEFAAFGGDHAKADQAVHIVTAAIQEAANHATSPSVMCDLIDEACEQALDILGVPCEE
jgi:hypothetical protein